MTNGPVIGFSEDGLVVLSDMSMCEGKPAQIIMQWTPELARNIGHALQGAAAEAEKKKNERNGANPH
jgi:hypothetical protein